MILTFTLTGGIVLLSLIILLLIGVRKKDLAHYLLIAIFATVWCFFLLLFAENQGVDWLYTACFILSDSIGLFLGPLMLLFIQRMLVLKPRKIGFILHFIPFVLHWTFLTIPLGITQYNLTELPAYFTWVDQHQIAVSGLENTYFLAYVLYAFYLLRGHLRTNNYSISLHWSLQFLVTTVIVTAIDQVFIITELIGGELSWYTGYVTIVSSFTGIFYLAYQAFKSGFATILAHQITDGRGLANSNILSTHFSPEKIAAIKVNLHQLLTEKKIYQDPHLSLSQLATEMNVSNKTLSLFINHELDLNFYQLINHHKIEDVKQKLKSDAYSNYSIMGIASESGFKSKTSFYRLFKQATNLSPAEYQKQGK